MFSCYFFHFFTYYFYVSRGTYLFFLFFLSIEYINAQDNNFRELIESNFYDDKFLWNIDLNYREEFQSIVSEPNSPYSQEYVSLLARQGKIDA